MRWFFVLLVCSKVNMRVENNNEMLKNVWISDNFSVHFCSRFQIRYA